MGSFAFKVWEQVLCLPHHALQSVQGRDFCSRTQRAKRKRGQPQKMDWPCSEHDLATSKPSQEKQNIKHCHRSPVQAKPNTTSEPTNNIVLLIWITVTQVCPSFKPQLHGVHWQEENRVCPHSGDSIAGRKPGKTYPMWNQLIRNSRIYPVEQIKS